MIASASLDRPRGLKSQLEAMALYAGQGVGRVADVVPAGERLRRIAAEAADLLARVPLDGLATRRDRNDPD